MAKERRKHLLSSDVSVHILREIIQALKRDDAEDDAVVLSD
jgi:signal recognition particle GTPase